MDEVTLNYERLPLAEVSLTKDAEKNVYFAVVKFQKFDPKDNKAKVYHVAGAESEDMKEAIILGLQLISENIRGNGWDFGEFKLNHSETIKTVDLRG